MVDRPKTETIVTPRLRHGAQERDTLIVLLTVDLRSDPGGGFRPVSSFQTGKGGKGA